MTKISLPGLRTLLFGLLICPLPAQWINYPSAGIPRTKDGKADLNAACPRTADGHPDFSGVWIAPSSREGNPQFPGCEPIPDEFANIAAHLKDGLPYQPWAAQLVNARRTEQRVHDPLSHCLPIGPVRLHTLPGLRKVTQTSGLIVILNEWNASYRQIFTDGRPLPEDPNPSWNGYSSATWQGDTLVVQTNGLRDGLWLDALGNPLTGAALLIERFRRPNFGRLEIEITVDDPKAYTRPFTFTVTHRLQPDTDLLDFVCSENEKDAPRLSSK